jgi:hypothetical protein
MPGETFFLRAVRRHQDVSTLDLGVEPACETRAAGSALRHYVIVWHNLAAV